MPANTSHKSFPQPPIPGTPVWRYLDLPRLVLMLHRSGLYFRRLDLFEDGFEGRWPKASLERIRAGLVPGLPKFNEKVLEDHLDRTISAFKEVPRTYTYANCWCVQDYESEALWGRYGKNAAVAVRSTYSHLANALPSNAMIGAIQYIDHATSDIPAINVLDVVMHKRREFSFESEVRACLLLPDECFGEPGPDGNRPTRHPFPDGVWRSVDLVKMECAVVVSPYADKCFEEAVKCVVERFAPHLRVQRSTMILESE